MIEKRYIEISFTIHGTGEQADVVRNAVGEAIDDVFLGSIITPIVNSESIKHVQWEVRGYRWVQGEPDNQSSG